MFTIKSLTQINFHFRLTEKGNTMEKEYRIVIFTDCTDVAYNELCETIYSELAARNIFNFTISPLVPIRQFSICNAAFVIRLLADICLPGTIFFVVANATNRKPARMIGQTKNGILFVGNNSGFFNWMIEDFGLEWLYKNKEDRLKNNRSFGGKHVGAPTVAKLIAGTPLNELGDQVSQDFLSDFFIQDGTVVHCDNFGLMKIKHSTTDNLREGAAIKIFVNNECRVDGIFTDHWKTQKDGVWVLFPGSSLNAMPELGRVRSPDSAKELGVREGDIISWEVK